MLKVKLRLPKFFVFFLIGPFAHVYVANREAICAKWVRLVHIDRRRWVFPNAKPAPSLLRRVLTSVDLRLNRYLNQANRLVKFALGVVSKVLIYKLIMEWAALCFVRGTISLNNSPIAIHRCWHHRLATGVVGVDHIIVNQIVLGHARFIHYLRLITIVEHAISGTPLHDCNWIALLTLFHH